MIWESDISTSRRGARWRLSLLVAAALAVLMGLFQNCGRWQGTIESPQRVYDAETLDALSDLSDSQKANICGSAANYQCQRLRLGSRVLDRDLAEMVCLDHEAFPRRVCIQTDYLERSAIDPEIPCEMCKDIKSLKGKGQWEEYSCFNAALKIRTLIEHRLFGGTLEEALTRAYLACRAI
ncbi:MAG: hypothetical protein H6624_06915 [Bdellovibrionaceae bacterium]|nr:hypothetical protein [Bdellovibrionales bacterium]MCB9084057.1 hypothetical protein [Pseudobdellovibrionaceae bacterium]